MRKNAEILTNPIRNFLWRTKDLEAVCKHDWHNVRLYYFFNVWTFWIPCARTFRHDITWNASSKSGYKCWLPSQINQVLTEHLLSARCSPCSWPPIPTPTNPLSSSPMDSAPPGPSLSRIPPEWERRAGTPAFLFPFPKRRRPSTR